MARKRYGEDDILRLIREVEVHCSRGMDVVSACRAAGVSDKTYYGWRRKYGGMNRARLSEMKSLEKENQRHSECVMALNLCLQPSKHGSSALVLNLFTFTQARHGNVEDGENSVGHCFPDTWI